MKKDVIYIDIEDDITAVIEKLKASKEKIIALVPPKGNAVLQSVVNLKLLKRAAESVDKQPVIVTSNHALTALAGGLELYVAKNLQSKPVLASAPDEALAEEADVDVGEPVGDLSQSEPGETDDSSEVELSDAELAAVADQNTPESPKKAKAQKGKKSKKIPDFNSFKKKLLIIAGIIFLLLIVGIALFGRTKASIVVRAETTPVDVAVEATVNSALPETNAESYNIKAERQQSQKTVSQTVTATGQKDQGTKASGTVSLQNCSRSDNAVTIPAGTGVSANNLTFVVQQTTALPSSSFSGSGNCRTASVSTPVAAQNNGDQYNLSSRSYSVSGYGDVKASGSQMSGGTTKIVKVISQSDVDKAKTELSQQDSAAIKKELTAAFGEGVTVLEDSFTTTLSSVVSEPAVGSEANEGKVTAQATYSLLGVKNDDLKDALEAYIKTQMNNPDQQQVYQNGFDNIKFEKIDGDDKSARYKITTVGQYGPRFDIEELKQKVTAKKAGEVRSTLQDLPGVKTVELNFSPFWANKTPNPDRINIKLDVDETVGG